MTPILGREMRTIVVPKKTWLEFGWQLGKRDATAAQKTLETTHPKMPGVMFTIRPHFGVAKQRSANFNLIRHAGNAQLHLRL